MANDTGKDILLRIDSNSFESILKKVENPTH